MSSQQDGQPRRVGGRYRLSAHLGSGAMGTVWSGYDEVLQRRVAIKELKIPPGVPAHEARDMRERIMREARALGGLSHPNIITVFDVVVDEGAPVVVLEMVPSRDLATMIGEQGSLSMPQAAVIGFTTAGALRAAHRSGITHRDVKPGNVLVADDGRVKLTDFGIARNVADAPMTSAGLVLGSPAYIAPEVAAGQPVTPAADLWGLGATLFAAIEGRPPYDVQGDPVRTITEVVDGAVPRPRATGAVADVIIALMVKDPERRMTLDEVRRRLRPLILDPDDPVYPGSPDAPTLASPIARLSPAPRPAAAPSLVKGEQRPATPPEGGVTRSGGQPPSPTRSGGQRPVSRSGPLSASGPVPLAADPGPLPPGLASAGRPPVSPTPAGPPTATAGPGRPASAAAGPGRPASTAGPGRPAPAAGQGRPGPAQMRLAAAPGSLPPGLRQPAVDPGPRVDQPPAVDERATGWVAAALVVAGATVVLVGIAVGWTVTRAVAGESPLSTVSVTNSP